MKKILGLLIFDFGGHARSVADIALACGIAELRFIDATAREDEMFLGFPVVKQWNGNLPQGWQAFSATGDNNRRQQQCEFIKDSGWPLATLIAPSATICADSAIGEGCLIAHQAHVGPAASIEMGCIVNTGAVIDHESSVGRFSHVSVNSTVAGRCKIGSFTMIGAGATVIDGVEVGDNIMVGAGAVVHRSLHQPGIYVGVPARRIEP